MAHSGKSFSMHLLFVRSNLLVFSEHHCAYILFPMPLSDSGLLGLFDLSLFARTVCLFFLKSSFFFVCGLRLSLASIEVFLGLLEICEYYLIF